MNEIENVKKLHAEGQFDAAISAYKEILTAEPNNDEAHFGLAHASSRINDVETALEHVELAVKLSPNSEKYHQFKGQMLLANKRIDEALKAFKRSIKENPNLFYSYLAIGDIYAMKDNFVEAEKHYKLALKVYDDGIPAITRLAKLYMLFNDLDGAEKVLQTAELRFPEETNLKTHMGILRLEQGQEGFAELYFKKIIESEPDNFVAKAYLAISLLKADPSQALQITNELINKKAHIPELMIALGLMHVKSGHYVDAIGHLQPICQSGLAYPSWMVALALAYAGVSKPDQAEIVLQDVLRKGNHSQALMMLAQIHQANKDYGKALKVFNQIGQNSNDYLHSLLMQAECLYAMEKHDLAIEKIDTILNSNPDHNTAVKLKLNALSQLHRYEDALELIDAIDENKQSDQFNQLMDLYAGLLLDAKQDYQKAWHHFSKIKPPKSFEVQLLTADEEKQVQAFETQTPQSLFRFVFTDPATGHHDFINWLLDNNVTPMIDRFTSKSRKDLFNEEWTVKKLAELDQTQIHFFRKKYVKQLNLLIDNNTQNIADFIPFSPINLAIIKRVFPKAQVLVLSRNFADLRLHNHVFGSFQVHYSQFSKVINQMVAMNPNLSMVDIDAWQDGDEMTINNIEKVFGDNLTPFKVSDVTPLDRLIFPYMHWKNYQQQLNP